MTTARSLFGELRSALAGRRDDPTLVERVLDSSPPGELTVLAWLCEQLPSFDYSNADIERLFSGLRAKFKNEWLGVHVLSGDLAHHIDFAGRPSLGLFLAMTAPEEIDVEPFETEDSFSRSLDDARFHLLLDHVDR